MSWTANISRDMKRRLRKGRRLSGLRVDSLCFSLVQLSLSFQLAGPDGPANKVWLLMTDQSIRRDGVGSLAALTRLK